MKFAVIVFQGPTVMSICTMRSRMNLVKKWNMFGMIPTDLSSMTEFCFQADFRTGITCVRRDCTLFRCHE